MKFFNKSRLFCFALLWTLEKSFSESFLSGAKADISENVVRLHIVANSNSDSDQAVKLKIRDRILKEGENIFSSSENPDDVLRLANENKVLLKEIAEDELRKNGFSHKATVSVGEFFFPQKTYDKFSFPAGSYNAVKITIGEGEGKNWWCVMYPPLCFVQGVAKIPTETDVKMKENLSGAGYCLLTDGETGGVELRFKLLDMFGR